MNSVLDKYIAGFKKNLAFDLSVFDSSFLKRTIASRMALKSFENLDLYFEQLQNDQEELTKLQRCLNNSYSEFFRNPLTFSCFEQMILPLCYEKKRTNPEGEIRIWSAACASGQEAYSIAIVFDELNKTRKEKLNCRIFATDFDEEELVAARKGRYLVSSLSKVMFQRVQTYFLPDGEYYQISPQVKDYVNFSNFDLLSDRGFCPVASIYGNFDVIFCCNLLFYYTPPIRQRILDKMRQCLAYDGFLVSGETEREILKENGFREVIANSAIFQKR